MMHHYWELMSDPAHMLVEFTFVLIDVLIISWVKTKIVKHFHRDLKRRDERHGHNAEVQDLGRRHSLSGVRTP